MKILHLILKKKWFDMVSDPNPETRKDEEYREIKPYWINRLCSGFPSAYDAKDFDVVYFHWGYKKNHPVTIREWVNMNIGQAKPEWSDNWQGDVFVIKLGKILSDADTNT
jgi:hypothetical protein